MLLRLRRILAPLSYIKGIIIFSLFFRVSVFTTALISATALSNITNLAIKWASFESIVHATIPLIVSIIVNIILVIPHTRISTASIIRNKFWVNVERETLQKILQSDDASTVQSGIGKRVSLIQNGHSNWTSYVVTLVGDFGVSLFFLLGSIVYIAIRNPIVIPFVMVYMVMMFLFVRTNQKKIKPLREERRKIGEEWTRRYVRAIMEKLSVVLLGAIKKEEEYHKEMADSFMDKIYKIERRWALAWWLPRFFLDFIRLGIIVTIGYLITQGKAQAGDIVAFGIIFSMIEGNFQRVLDSYQAMEDQVVQMDRLFDYLDNLKPLHRLSNGNAFMPKKGEIVFENVHFSYPESNENAINNLSIIFEGGKKTALVGKSGAGKSTIVKLALGLMLPNSGKVLIDNQEISSIQLDTLFPCVGYLAQEPSVFDGTIRENLSYGLETSPSDEDLFSALRYARADFVEKYERWLQTEIGERGIRLSGWERQRLAIARVFLRNPSILILDEPTSALDSFSEKAVTDALHELFRGKTVIVVAHRLQTVKEADTIYVLGKNGIIESGNHETLLELDGEYAKMVDLQSGRMKDEDK